MKNSKLIKKAIEKGLVLCHCDIETSPELNMTYATRKTTIQHNQILNSYQITSIGWLFEDEGSVVVRGWDDSLDVSGKFDVFRNDRDKELLRSVVPILNEADILIGQNSIEFDEKKIRWRLNLLKLPPLNNLIPLDTLQLSRNVMSPVSQKLDYRSKIYGFGGKVKQDMDDCIAVALGDKKAQKERMYYNGKDVLDERKVFWRELDVYKLPAGILRAVKMYVDVEECTFCIRCAARRQAKFNVQRNKTKTGTKMTCRNCDYTWKVKE